MTTTTGQPEGGPRPHDDRAALQDLVARARDGDARALEAVVARIQPRVYQLALRFLWHPQDAEDACQEILVRVVTRLESFRGESAFTTWVYRVATNALLNMKKSCAEAETLGFDAFGEDLGRGLSDEPLSVQPDVERSLLLEEVKIGCTSAMLLCLGRDLRLAYILGEILGFDHKESAEILGVTPAAFRKRLSRARTRITDFMRGHCGLFEPGNPCRCSKRVARAVELGRVDPHALLFAGSLEQARRFPLVLEEIRTLDEMSRAAALYRSHPRLEPSRSFAAWLDELVGQGAGDVAPDGRGPPGLAHPT